MRSRPESPRLARSDQGVSGMRDGSGGSSGSSRRIVPSVEQRLVPSVLLPCSIIIDSSTIYSISCS